MKEQLQSFFSSLVIILIVSLILMLCWNYSIPEIFNVKSISYKESVLLFIIANILFKNNNGK